jgi:site-specific recombinase XerD
MSREVAKQKFDKLLEGVNLVCPAIDRPLSNTGVRMILREVGERAGLKNVGAHMLRRSFATHLYDHGAGLEVIQALLGHVYLQTTLQYTRLSTGRLLKTFEKCHPRGRMKWAMMTAVRENQKAPVRNRIV